MKIILACAITAMATGTITAGGMQHHAAPAPSPYRNCIAAANRRPFFATEVCEPLMPGYREPQTVPLGIITQHHDDGSTITMPPLAVDIADSCPDSFEGARDVHAVLLDCARAIILSHQGR